MAKYLAQLIITGSQVIGRAFARALKQEIEASQQAAQRLGNSAKGRQERLSNQKTGLTLEEAKQILNVSDTTNREEIVKRYESLFKANEKNGTLYIQSKVVRAKERLDMELGKEEPPNRRSEGEKT